MQIQSLPIYPFVHRANMPGANNPNVTAPTADRGQMGARVPGPLGPVSLQISGPAGLFHPYIVASVRDSHTSAVTEFSV